MAVSGFAEMERNRNNTLFPFVLVLFIYQLFLGVLLAVYGYNGSFLMLNGFNAPLLDAPMFVLTHLGDALILTSLLGFLFVRKNPALVLLLILVVVTTGLTGQLMKNYLFGSFERPLSVFGESARVHTVYGYHLFRNSFPSGHSITVTAAITCLAMVLRPGKMVMVFLALFAAVVSYTRIYTGVHFAGDVLAGAIIGFSGSAFLTAALFPAIGRWTGSFNEKVLRRLKNGLYILAVIGFAGGILLIIDFLG